MSRVLAVIPARYASTRFPGKPLAPLDGRTMLEVVWQRARTARRLSRLIIATEDDRIVEAATQWGAEVLLTSDRHLSGSDRVAEVTQRVGEEFPIVVNIQGDEPLVTGASLDRLVAALENSPAPMATLAEPLEHAAELFDPQIVKVVTRHDGVALYFSRAPIPYHRAGAGPLLADFRPALACRTGQLAGYLKHQGIYAYRRATLLELCRLPPSALELDEGLEQLRALQAGWDIVVTLSDYRSLAVDTPEDLDRVRRAMAGHSDATTEVG